MRMIIFYQNLLTMPMCYSFILALTELRYSIRTTAAISAVFLTVMLSFNSIALNLSGEDFNPNIEITITLVNLVMVLLVTLLLSQYRDTGTLFTALTACLFSNLTLVLSYGLSLVTSSIPLILAVKVVIYVLLMAFTLRVLRRPLLDLRTYVGHRWLPLCAMPFFMLLALFLLLLYPANMFLQHNNLPAGIVLSFICILFYILLCFLLQALKLRYQQEDDTMVIQLLTHQLELSVRNNESLKIFRHDLRHYIHILSACLSSGDQDGAREVLQSINENIQALRGGQPVRNYTGAPILDTVISYYACFAEESGLEFTVQFSVEGLPMEPFDLAVMLSNSLENAEKACLKLPPEALRSIRLTGGPRGGQYFIEVANTYDGQLYFPPGSQLPVARERGHGYGTRSVAAFARKYNALLDCRAEDGWFLLRILI